MDYKHRVIKRFKIFKWKWVYLLQQYYCNYADCGWETLKEISKQDYYDLKDVI